MDENKNQEEILNDENQADGVNNQIENEISENVSEVENIGVLDTDENAEINFSYDSENDADIKKTKKSLKVLIPAVIVVAVIIVTAVLLALNGAKIKNSPSNTASTSNAEASFKIDGKEVDTDDLVFLKINGTEIGFDELRNNYYQFLYGYGQYYGISEDTFKNASGDDLKNIFNIFKDSLAEYVKGGYVHEAYAKENNITFDEKDEEALEKRIQSFKDEQGDNYEAFLKENYMTEEYLYKLMKNNVMAEKVEKTLSVSEKNFYKTAQKELYQTKQIFIPFGSEEKISDEVLSSNSIEDYKKLSKPGRAQAIVSNYNALSDNKKKKAKSASKKVADNIYNKLVSGADFDTLMKQNTYDSLYENYPKGILVGKDYEYDEDYLKAALKLNENEMSKVVESSSGYHIIMRVPLDKKYINKNLSYFAQTYNDNAINKILSKVFKTIKVEKTDIYKNFQYGDLT